MKKIIFLTGTRADFSKIKALISILDIHPDFEVFVLLRNAPARRVWIYTVKLNVASLKMFIRLKIIRMKPQWI
jgi:UDP-N-acetylglucosamine 2-epimerase